MKCITTFSGQEFDPINPDKDKILITDIAHSLSLLCRGNGHLQRFYSVAQHSINCCIEAKSRGYSKTVQLLCLLHDASEAYLGDVTRPLKANLTKYLEIEQILQNVIYEKYIEKDILDDELLILKQIDDDVLYFEFQKLMNKNIDGKLPQILGSLSLEFESFEEIESQFKKLFETLTKNSD